jgi:hypothetical protein
MRTLAENKPEKKTKMATKILIKIGYNISDIKPPAN